jgi:hypothetical protein
MCKFKHATAQYLENKSFNSAVFLVLTIPGGLFPQTYNYTDASADTTSGNEENLTQNPLTKTEVKSG